jgi:hypothetical protein
MKTSLSLCASLLLAAPLGAASASKSAPATTAPAAPFELPRLKDNSAPGQAAKLATTKVAIDELAVKTNSGAAKSKKDDVDFVALEANRQWTSKLRGSAKDITYASFMIHASQNTVVEIGGARLGVTAGPTPGSVQLMFDDATSGALQWKALNVHLRATAYGGHTMAALPVLTIAVDPAAGVWHLYLGNRLQADHLPLMGGKKESREITITAGNAGAWICGLVLADENPLFADDNFNGVDDAFEQQARGALQPAASTALEKQLLAKQWKDAQRVKSPPALVAQRPLPDNASR